MWTKDITYSSGKVVSKWLVSSVKFNVNSGEVEFECKGYIDETKEPEDVVHYRIQADPQSELYTQIMGWVDANAQIAQDESV